MRTSKLFQATLLGAGLLALGGAGVQAASIYKADVPDNLNLASSWTNGVAPGATDLAVWDHTVVNNLSSLPGDNLNWGGIQILDPAGSITIGADGFTLTNGALGIDLSTASQSLTLNNDVALGAAQTWSVAANQTLTAGGVVSGVGFGLTKGGGGTLVLGAANTFSGGMVINAGTLQVNTATSAGPSGSGITNTGGTLLFGAGGLNIVNVYNVSGTSTVDLNNSATLMLLSGAWSGAGTVNVTNLVTGGTFTIGGNGNGGGNMTGFTGTIALGTSSGTLRFNNGGGNNNVGNANAIFDLGTGSATFFSRNRNAAVNFGALLGGPNTTIRQGASSSGTSTYSIGAKNLDTTFAGQIIDSGTTASGLVALTKVGSGTLTLTGTNSYAGATTVTAGTLQIGDGGTDGTLGVGPVVNNATLLLNRSDNLDVSNAFSGSGITIKRGAGTLTYYGTNASSGALLVDAGTLALGSSGAVLGPVSIASGASFDVTANSAFTFNQALSGSGSVLGTATVIGGSIEPGGSGAAGTLTFANGLSESGGVSHVMEFSTPGGTNDLINVVGDLSLSGVNNIIANAFGAGIIPNGTYPLINYSGNLNGSLANLSVTVVGATGTLTNLPNQIALIISPPSRGATNLTWIGDGAANYWDMNVSTNWENGTTLFTFLAGDSVLFNAVGAANPVVNVNGLVLPADVVVDAANNYTLTGSGRISGSTGLTKTNSGTLTVLTTNDYSGPTVLGGGVLEASTLANGAFSSAIGASTSDPTNLMFYGSTLRYLGTTAGIDRGATLNGVGGIVDIATATENLTLNGAWTGPGSLAKTGAGTLTLAVPNDYAGGTVISNGVLALGSNAANNSGATGGLGPTNSPATFYGGTLQLFGYNGSTANNYSTLRNPLIVPAGQSGTLQMFPRGPSNTSGLASSLSGGGTLNLVVNYVRDSIDGDWSAFTGLINVVSKSGVSDEFRINNAAGFPNAAVFLNDGVIMDRANTANSTIDIGEMGGTSLAIVGPGNSSAINPTWRVGGKNTTATFAGSINDDGVTTVVKVGTGTWILTGVSSYTGPTLVSNGVLALSAGLAGDGTILYSTNISVASGAVLDVSGRSDGTLILNAGQTLSGSGTVRGSVDTAAGGMVAPGDSLGTLTVTSNVNLSGSGVTAIMEINRASSPNSDKLVAANIALGGTLQIVNLGDNLQVGDTFDLFDGAITDLGVMVQGPAGVTFDTSQLAVNGTITVTAVPVPPQITGTTLDSTGTNLVVSGSGGVSFGTYEVLTSTNLAAPIATWTPVATNSFGSDGSFSFTQAIDPTAPALFMRIHQE